jgi:hypothetical protein
MKRINALLMLTLAAFLAFPGARAQKVELTTRIPFQFTVSKTTLPAGTYLISSPWPGVIRIENVDKNLGAGVTTTHEYQVPRGGDKLVFNKYGEQYFLHAVLCSETAQMNVDLPTGNQENRARTREAKLNQADQVLVAAN